MFSRKKETKPKSRDRGDLSQYGLFGMSNDLGGMDDDNDDDGDSDLEAELAAIASGGRPKARPKPKPVVPAADLDRMIADSLKDIGSDEELSGDDDDPSLLNELSEITGDEPEQMEEEEPEPTKSSEVDVVTLLRGRLQMYKIAESNAKTAGDSSKARRFNRGLKTVQDMLKKAEAGRPINIDEIPPEVSTKPIEKPPSVPTSPSEPAPPLVPTRPAPPPVPQTLTEREAESPTEPENPVLTMLKSRQQEYKIYALNFKKSGDNVKALKFVKIAKQFEPVIKAVESGQEVDLSNMPPPPAAYEDEPEIPAPVISAEPPPEPVAREETEVQNSSEELPEETLITASSVGEALQQRLDKYKAVEQAAKDEENTSKARRFGRIVKQYQDAIKLHKAGKPVPYEDLPCPPGFGPLPLGDAGGGPAPPATPAPVLPVSPPKSAESDTPPAPPPRRPPLQKQDSRVMGNHVSTHIMDVQINEIKKRQKEFREAALNAKKGGDIEQAKEYLRTCKGLERVLEAAEGGFPVDMATLPIPPSARNNLEDSFQFVNEMDCDENNADGELNKRLEEQLQKQLAMCKTTRDHLRAVGDVPGTNRFENLALSVQKDLDILRLAHKKSLPIPKFHYKMESFNIVRCHTDLTDNQVEIGIIRGINYNVPNPKDIDTYVRMEFPYPTDEFTKNKTAVIKNTDNPEYNEHFTIDIQRSARTCQRVFKSKAVKFEIYSKGGFLRSDVLIGNVMVKLQPLETTVEIHDSFDVMDGRKKVGGKLEVKIRLRKPILAQQIEQINEKWLIIDH